MDGDGQEWHLGLITSRRLSLNANESLSQSLLRRWFNCFALCGTVHAPPDQERGDGAAPASSTGGNTDASSMPLRGSTSSTSSLARPRPSWGTGAVAARGAFPASRGARCTPPELLLFLLLLLFLAFLGLLLVLQERPGRPSVCSRRRRRGSIWDPQRDSGT